MAHAYTTHRIVEHGNDRMVMTDCDTGLGVLEAVRDGRSWVINVNGAERQRVPVGDSRDATITAMNKLALELSPEKWISIKEPHQVIDDDGNTLHIRDKS